jgi:hypothetical protein
MQTSVDYTKELTELVVDLKNNLNTCVDLIAKIVEENKEIKTNNLKVETDYTELKEEMENYTKVSFLSNLSKQITDKDHQIVALKRKLCKLEAELTKQKSEASIKTDDLLIEVNPNKNLINSDTVTLSQNEKRDFPEQTIRIEHSSLEACNNTKSNINKKNEEQHSEEEVDEEEVDEDGDESEDESEDEVDEEDSEDEDEEDEEDSEEEDEEDSEDEDEVEFSIEKINNKDYYISNENPQCVYLIDEDEDIGEKIGEFINNKLVKSTK